MALAGGGSRRRKRARRNAANPDIGISVAEFVRRAQRKSEPTAAAAFRYALKFAKYWNGHGVCERAKSELAYAKASMAFMPPNQRKVAQNLYRKTATLIRSCRVKAAK